MVNYNYTQSEQVFSKIAHSYIQQAKNKSYLTHFLNPREQEIILIEANREGVVIEFSGGYLNAERKRAILNPEIDPDFEIELLEISYPEKFFSIYHSTVLGSLIHNGISFEMIGDVFHQGTIWQIAIEKKLASVVINDIKNVGKKRVDFIYADQTIQADDDFINETMTVSSLRLDLVIAEVFNISRNDSKELVENGGVRLNYFDFDNPSYQLLPMDLVSVHGNGRFRFLRTTGGTNRNKLKIEIQKISR